MVLSDNFIHLQGLRIDYFYLTSMPITIMVGEPNQVHETMNNNWVQPGHP